MMYQAAVFLPLLSFILAGTLGFKIGNRLTNYVTVSLMAVACLFSWKILTAIHMTGLVQIIELGEWMTVGNFKVSWALQFDILSAIMITVVNTVSFLVHLYSVGYMSHDRTVPRFMAYLGLFTFMMLMLVTAPNLIQIFFGWEGVGLASYLLIGYWYERPSAHAAAMKAFVINRVGDLGLILGLGGLFVVFQSMDISTILNSAAFQSDVMFTCMGYSVSALEIIGILLFIGAMGKSAQFGLHVWLADAMEGPTPVSALIHAATMVTAGVFLLVRLSPLYALLPYCKNIITVVGAITALFAATVALTQNDIKKIIAYSTCSQLGYMFFAIGVSAYGVAMFHLITHAFFKALLFLGAGSVIHAMSDEQDIQKMGGIWHAVPITYSMMWIGSLALAGIPFFAGYYSKDAILEAAWSSGTLMGKMAYVVGILTALLTAYYTWRLLYKVFVGKPRADEHVMGHLHEPEISMLLPLAALAIGAIFAGIIGKNYFLEPTFWQGTIVTHGHIMHTSNGWIEILPTIMAAIGIVIATIFYVWHLHYPQKLMEQLPKLYQFLFNKWYIDELYKKIIVTPLLYIGRLCWLKGDSKIIDGYGPDGISRWAIRIASQTSQMQTGFINHYALIIITGVIIGIGWIFIIF